MKIYDRNRNALKLGQRVMIAATGAVDFLKEAHTDNMTPYQAEHEKCVLLANTQERYAPIELIRLGYNSPGNRAPSGGRVSDLPSLFYPPIYWIVSSRFKLPCRFD